MALACIQSLEVFALREAERVEWWTCAARPPSRDCRTTEGEAAGGRCPSRESFQFGGALTAAFLLTFG